MRKTYHICLSAGNSGLLCRSEEDCKYLVNCIGLAAFDTETVLLAYAVMSNHVHCCVRTKDVHSFIKRWRYMYTRYFNRKYHRVGTLGGTPFLLELKGLFHILTAIAYVLRNPMHHGVSATPFGYRYSSVNAVFKKEMGRQTVRCLPAKSMYRHLPESSVPPTGWLMDETGLFLPECLIDVEDVEHMFSTARSYLYYMNRLSSKRWEEEQAEDGGGMAPVTIYEIEHGVSLNDMKTMLNNEFGRANYNAMSDTELCGIIDDLCHQLHGVTSVYQLDMDTRLQWVGQLVRSHHVTVAQAFRCLAIPGPSDAETEK